MVLCPRSEPVNVHQSTCCAECFAAIFHGFLRAVCQPCRRVTVQQMGQDLVGMLERASVGQNEAGITEGHPDAAHAEAQDDHVAEDIPHQDQASYKTAKKAEKLFRKAEEACRKAEASYTQAAASSQKAKKRCERAAESYQRAEAALKTAADASDDAEPHYHWPDD
ncbi:hypothetical protein LTR85_005368 [Meristemomyces frigidus]|nr:hypothetical protein LTR85_005368 [Meristemomyces frigidus]